MTTTNIPSVDGEPKTPPPKGSLVLPASSPAGTSVNDGKASASRASTARRVTFKEPRSTPSKSKTKIQKLQSEPSSLASSELGDSDGEEDDIDSLDEGSLDEGDPNDEDDENDGSTQANDATGVSPKRRLVRKGIVKKYIGPSNSAFAIHRRTVRRMKEISYWGDQEVEPDAAHRKLAARHFLYDICAPARGNIRFLWHFDIKKEVEELARDGYINRTRGNQDVIQLDKVADSEEISGYYWQYRKAPLTLLLGPFTQAGHQKKVQLKMHETVDLAEADLYEDKNGFVIHVGNEVQSMDWATRQPGDTQFLAIGTTFQEARPTIHSVAPGFAPCVGPSQLQIWRIPISKPRTPSKPLPTLEYTLLTDFGAPKEIKFRPGVSPIPEMGIIGHVMALFEDGKGRLIEVKDHYPGGSPAPSQDAPIYKLNTPMLTLHLRDGTILTTFTWINSFTIVFGCSNGSVALWDLNSTHVGKEHFPTRYYNVQCSYIATITTLAPSFPDLIATSSLDGSYHIHDLREPQSTDTLIHRSRTVAMSTPIAWSEIAQSLCYPEDLCGILCMGIRKAKKSGGFLCSNSPGDCVSTSTGAGGFHPFLLSGGRDGKVKIVNLIRKYFYSKCQAIQQVWFQLEYAPTTGMFRMLDGFMPEMVVHRNKVFLGLAFYPYQGNITTVCWNNNRKFATWAAAGTGCGLVRLEDVSLDVNAPIPED